MLVALLSETLEMNRCAKKRLKAERITWSIGALGIYIYDVDLFFSNISHLKVEGSMICIGEVFGVCQRFR